MSKASFVLNKATNSNCTLMSNRSAIQIYYAEQKQLTNNTDTARVSASTFSQYNIYPKRNNAKSVSFARLSSSAPSCKLASVATTTTTLTTANTFCVNHDISDARCETTPATTPTINVTTAKNLLITPAAINTAIAASVVIAVDSDRGTTSISKQASNPKTTTSFSTEKDKTSRYDYELTYYINDVTFKNTQVAQVYGKRGEIKASYTYGDVRTSSANCMQLRDWRR